MPVESVRHCFKHFETLELDFTFYRPLLEPGGDEGTNYHVLSRYAEHAPADASFVLKAPQAYFARTLRRSGSYVENEQFLDPEAYVQTFHEPALDILGDRLDGIIFEQEYQRVSDSPEPERNVDELDGFFSAIPGNLQAHLELRSKHLLTEGYFKWLEERGLGFVFSHWTWLPRIKKQWEMCGGRLTAANDEVIARLLTPRNMKYAEAYARTNPFGEPVSELAESEQGQEMVLDTTALAFQAEAQGAELSVYANNRAWGNAPDLARAVAHRILDEEERRSEAGSGD